MLQQRHEHGSHDNGVGRLDTEAHADDFQSNEQQDGINHKHGDTRGDACAPINQCRNTAHAAAHKVVRDKEGRPAQTHSE